MVPGYYCRGCPARLVALSVAATHWIGYVNDSEVGTQGHPTRHGAIEGSRHCHGDGRRCWHYVTLPSLNFSSMHLSYSVTIPYEMLDIRVRPSALMLHPTSAAVSMSADATSTFAPWNQPRHFEGTESLDIPLTEGETREVRLTVQNQDKTNETVYSLKVNRAASRDASISFFQPQTDEVIGKLASLFVLFSHLMEGGGATFANL